ncbi:hypothetical protein PR048_025779 [Dryococelus australis]|uniref:Uncharacterized protein n=1 Tax=Dryococelus australis TaxID=614101 RepID=A0ABQ9GJH6_9NEOP|nr:hypothetical protein PR048_025779 [Dryococelus australis]
MYEPPNHSGLQQGWTAGPPRGGGARMCNAHGPGSPERYGERGGGAGSGPTRSSAALERESRLTTSIDVGGHMDSTVAGVDGHATEVVIGCEHHLHVLVTVGVSRLVRRFEVLDIVVLILKIRPDKSGLAIRPQKQEPQSWQEPTSQQDQIYGKNQLPCKNQHSSKNNLPDKNQRPSKNQLPDENQRPGRMSEVKAPGTQQTPVAVRTNVPNDAPTPKKKKFSAKNEKGVEGDNKYSVGPKYDGDFINALTCPSPQTFAATSGVKKAEDAENTGYIYPEDPNELLDRLRHLIASQQNGYFTHTHINPTPPPLPPWGRGIVVRLLASHQGEPCSIPGRADPGFSHVGIAPDDAAGRRVFSGISRLLRPCILTLLHTHIASSYSYSSPQLLTTDSAASLSNLFHL